MSSIRLTDTEKAIVKEYLNGLAPKEIAEKLKVSIKTVYKALSKYRKIQREKGQAVESRPKSITSKGGEILVNEEMLLRVLAKIIAEAFKELHLKNTVEVEYVKHAETKSQIDIEVLHALVKELSNLTEQLRELNKNLRSLRYIIKISELPTREEGAPETKVETLPSYLRENPWVEVLKRRSTESI